MKNHAIHAVCDPTVQMSRIALLSELVERASERIEGLKNPNELDYSSTVSEVQLITVRINEIIESM